ncbi:SOS response-associated peptidase [Longibaculum muris]|uniref:SOS response-associated peptidase n=1 Tax=Longibaculum muris TaxID=1796628 RepID=UPI0018A059BB|nr:SOS response-associated peptidase family protein [Longibaculum muris]
MCGRYYFDGDTYRLVGRVIEDCQYDYEEYENDFYPGDNIPVLAVKSGKLTLTPMKWGYSMNNSSKRVINARCETVLEKKMFSQDALTHRCLIPAKGFYEWDSHKHKVSFESQKNRYLLMAGIYRVKENEVTIITTMANSLMKPIHSRMPLMIDEQDIQRWLYDNQYLESFLTSTTDDLNIVSGQIQESLFGDDE